MFPLDDFQFWLQDAHLLDINGNLADQCITGEGLVQINCEVMVKQRKVNIVDILKPSDDILASSSRNRRGENNASRKTHENTNKNWAIDNAFKRDQIRLKIPDNPEAWNKSHVQFWLNWAAKKFSSSKIYPELWDMTGAQLSKMTIQEFNKKVPSDPGNLFWTHFELLRKCKYVAVQHKGVPPPLTNPASLQNSSSATREKPVVMTGSPKKDFNDSYSKISTNSPGDNSLNKSMSGGQIQLWQFLLEILTDVKYLDIIQWEGDEGEFKLFNAERVAQLWGERKNRPNMNYEKLSRALRYYYEGDMLAKIPNKRFVYKFVCDLKGLLGYDAAELARLMK